MGPSSKALPLGEISDTGRAVIWHTHRLKSFPQFVVIHTVKGFSIVDKAEVDILLQFSCFYYDPMNVDNLSSGSSVFSKSSLNI